MGPDPEATIVVSEATYDWLMELLEQPPDHPDRIERTERLRQFLNTPTILDEPKEQHG